MNTLPKYFLLGAALGWLCRQTTDILFPLATDILFPPRKAQGMEQFFPIMKAGDKRMDVFYPRRNATNKGFTVEIRDAPPVHFLTKIRVDFVLDNLVKFCQSTTFTVDNNTWSLVIGSEGEHISAYVYMVRRSRDWHSENAVFKIFLFNHKLDKYLCYQGNVGYDGLFTKFISKKALRDPSNGFIIDNNCSFGVEIFINEMQQVIRPSIKLSCLKGVDIC